LKNYKIDNEKPCKTRLQLQQRQTEATTKGDNCESLQLKSRTTSRQSFWALTARPITHQPTYSTLRKAFQQTCWIAV